MKFELAKMKMLWFFLLAVFTLPAFAQEKSISGTVSDASNNEPPCRRDRPGGGYF